MSDRKDTLHTQVDLEATVMEPSRVAEPDLAQTPDGEMLSLMVRNPVFQSPDSLDMDLSDPSQRNFGDYELLEKIGQGGMGIVYRAHQKSLDREVALKLLSAGPWAPENFIERFQLEAQSAARLEHPNIVTVHEVGSRDDVHYFSMRLVRGEPLSAIVRRRGGMPPREAAEILRVVAEAVDYAHRLGVLHLDLKPANVLVDATGVPLVADFGLARRLDQALSESSGDSAGTPSYMAPEQVDSSATSVSVATDIYGLGCILYEMLCVRPPFIAPTVQETLARVVKDAVVPPHVHVPSVPLDLEAICLKCMRKNPAERYQSAAEVAEDLRAFLADRPVSVRRPPMTERLRRWVRREPRLAAAVAGVAAALIVGLGATSQQWQRAESNAFAALQLIWEARREAALQLEQDGLGHEARDRLLANLREQEAAGEIDQAEMERVRIGVMLDRGARLIDAMAVTDARPMVPRLSPDGSMLAVAFSDLTVRWYDTGALEELGRVSLESYVAPGGTNGIWRTSDGEARLPQLLRFVDEQRLLVTLEWIANRVSPTEADTWLVDLALGTVLAPPDGFTVAAFDANADHALLSDTGGRVELWRASPDWSRLNAVATTDGQTQTWLLGTDGRLAFSLGAGMRGLRVYELTSGSEPHLIDVPGTEGISAWALSGDGSKLAIGTFDGNSFLLDTQTLELHQLPGQRGREITWIDFAENDTWLATAEYDGLVQIVDLAANDLLVGVGMRAGFAVTRVGVSRNERLVIATGQGQSALWRLPRLDLRVRPAERIGTPPAEHAPEWRLATDWSLDTGLFVDVAAGLDGQIRFWRLPPSPSISATPPEQTSDDPLHYDDRLIDIDWSRVRLVSPTGSALTPWLELSQPPGFAELVGDGRILLLTVGSELHAYDVNGLVPRYAPVQLPGTPERMLAMRDGRFVLLSFGEHGDYGHEEYLRSFNAVDGQWLSGETVLDGPTRRYAFSPDGKQIVAQGPPLGVTTVLARDSLETINYYVHDPADPVASLNFEGKQLLLLTQPNPEDGYCAFPSRLHIWNPVTNVEQLRPLEGNPCVIETMPTGYGVFGLEYDQLLSNNGESVRLPRLVSATGEGKPVATISADGRILARGFRHWAQLHDAVSGEPIGVPLNADIGTYDLLSELEFVDDGRALRGHSMMGVTLEWSTRAATDEFLATLQELSLLTSNDRYTTAIDSTARDGQRRIRAADPGPWTRPIMESTIVLASNSRPGIAIPARAPSTPATLLDLGPAYNQSPWEHRNMFFYAMWGTGETPLGLQHIGGVDFDIRGLVQLGVIEDNAGLTPQNMECLPVPPVPIAAIHVLAHSGLDTPVSAGETLAELTLRYTDGTTAPVPLRAGIELMSYGFDDSLVPSVFATFHRMWRAGGRLYELVAPRLANPEPTRPIRCLDLSWVEPSGSLTVFAITVEPIDAMPGAINRTD